MTLDNLHAHPEYKRVLAEFERLPCISSCTVEYKNAKTGEHAIVEWVGDDSYRLAIKGQMVAA